MFNELHGLSTLALFSGGIILVALEMVIPGIFIIWFGVAALIIATLSLFLPLSLPIQLLIFALLSFFISIWGARFYGKKEQSTHGLNQARGSEYIGQIFTLTESVNNGEGRLTIGDTRWLIKGEAAKKGAQIEITAVEMNQLHYHIISQPKDEHEANE